MQDQQLLQGELDDSHMQLPSHTGLHNSHHSQLLGPPTMAKQHQLQGPPQVDLLQRLPSMDFDRLHGDVSMDRCHQLHHYSSGNMQSARMSSHTQQLLPHISPGQSEGYTSSAHYHTMHVSTSKHPRA